VKTNFWYSGGVLAGVANFSYTNIPSGGLFIIYRNTNLWSGYTSVPVSGGTTFSENDTYQMDSTGRVTAMLIHRNSTSLSQKQVFIYY
jgi:hypothetical protein